MIEAILEAHGAEMLGAMKQAGGLSTDEAESLLPPALANIGDVLQRGDVDRASLLGGGDIASLLGKLDLSAIAAQAGLSEAQARSGLMALIPVVLSLLGKDSAGAGSLLSMLGGASGAGGDAVGALGGLAGKLFGR